MASNFSISTLCSAAVIFFTTSLSASFADTIASVVDDEGNNLLLASSPNLAVSLEEGGAITAAVKLNSQPKSEVRISFASSGLLELGVCDQSNLGGDMIPYCSPPVLIFDRSNWNVPQTVSILSIEDGVADGTRTLPVRMSISIRGRATVTNPIWVHSIDSEAVTVPYPGIEPFISSGTLDKMFEGGTDNGLSRVSDATAVANYDGTKGTAKLRVNSRKLNLRNLIIEIDYTIGATIDAQNKIIVGQVRGLNSQDLSLDLNYKPRLDYRLSSTYANAFGLSGVMTIRRPKLGTEDTFFVTSSAKDQSSFDINQYAGMWFEQGTAKKKGAAKLVNATYTYTPQPDATVSVEYVGKYGNINGAVQKAVGVATPVRDLYSTSTNTQFKIRYSRWNSIGPPSGDYKIVDFAPDYSWAIASDTLGANGVILTRDRVITEADYSALLNRAKWLGVNTKQFKRTTQIAPP